MEINLTRNHEVVALLSGLRIQRCRELCCRPEAVALIRPLAWGPPYANEYNPKKKKKKKKRKKKKERERD